MKQKSRKSSAYEQRSKHDRAGDRSSLSRSWHRKLLPRGYHLNPDTELQKPLLPGLIENEKRYGYSSCPCRLAPETKMKILISSAPVTTGARSRGTRGLLLRALCVGCHPEGRKDIVIDSGKKTVPGRAGGDKSPPSSTFRRSRLSRLALQSLRLSCAREEPPGTCPICKAKKERFERFI